jgi:hypothetical protein
MPTPKPPTPKSPTPKPTRDERLAAYRIAADAGVDPRTVLRAKTHGLDALRAGVTRERVAEALGATGGTASAAA